METPIRSRNGVTSYAVAPLFNGTRRYTNRTTIDEKKTANIWRQRGNHQRNVSTVCYILLSNYTVTKLDLSTRKKEIRTSVCVCVQNIVVLQMLFRWGSTNRAGDCVLCWLCHQTKSTDKKPIPFLLTDVLKRRCRLTEDQTRPNDFPLTERQHFSRPVNIISNSAAAPASRTIKSYRWKTNSRQDGNFSCFWNWTSKITDQRSILHAHRVSVCLYLAIWIDTPDPIHRRE